jgi:hypothetical protein
MNLIKNKIASHVAMRLISPSARFPVRQAQPWLRKLSDQKNIFVPCQPDKSDQPPEMEEREKVLLLVDEAQVMADGHPEHPNAFLGMPYRLRNPERCHLQYSGSRLNGRDVMESYLLFHSLSELFSISVAGWSD